MTTKFNERMANPSAFANIKRKAYRRDPVANALLEVLPLESPRFMQALTEMQVLRSYDIPITPELVRKVGLRHAKYAPAPEYHHISIPTSECVYYARLGNRVKIGTTTDLRARMEAIQPEELLITEPGGHALEHMRHLEFAHLRTHREWFRYQGLLVVHINWLKESADRFIVDTAALAVSLKTTPENVRLLVSRGVIEPIDRKMIRKTGRPSMQFDLEEAHAAVETWRAGVAKEADHVRN